MKPIEPSSSDPRPSASTNGLIRSRVRSYIRSHFPRARDLDLDDEISLLQGGIVNSMGILDIVTFLEDEFDLLVEDDELRPQNFDSVAAVARFVELKRRRGGEG